MFSAATDTILPLMPSLRPQRGRSDGAAGATLMRSANQFNKRAPPRNGRTRQRRRVEDEGQTQRREANALTSRGAARNARTYTGGQRARLMRGQERQQEHRTRGRGQLEVAPRNYRDASHRSGMARETPRGYVGPMATPRTKRGGGAQAAGASRHPPLAPLLPHPTRNTQTKHLGMAGFACRA